jgi:hypothetical protein
MDATTSGPRNTGNMSGNASTSPRPKFDFNKAMAIEAYRRAGEGDLSRDVLFDAKILLALKKWASHDEVRIEFYTDRVSGEVRVKVINNDAGGKTCDMSLATFMVSSPATI